MLRSISVFHPRLLSSYPFFNFLSRLCSTSSLRFQYTLCALSQPFTTTSPTAVPPASSCAVVGRPVHSWVDLVDVLERGCTVRLDALKDSVVAASRDPSGSYTWIELTPAFHGSMARMCHRTEAAWVGSSSVPRASVRNAKFEFLLRILNGHVAAVFRLDQKVARD